MAKLYPHFDLAEKIGTFEVEVPAGSVQQVITTAAQRYGLRFDDVVKGVVLLVNGVSINHLAGLKTHVKDKDEVRMVFFSTGG